MSGIGGTGTNYIPGWSNIPSADNSSEVAATAFTGDWEYSPQPWVGVTCYSSNQSGTITIQFSNNGTAVHSTINKNVTAGVSRFIPLLKLARYVRVSWSSSVAPTTFSLQTSFGMYAPGISSLGTTILDDDNAQLVRAVISGIGNTNAVVTGHRALQVTPSPDGKTAFGDTRVAAHEPVIQLTFPYNINTYIVEKEENGGTVTAATSMMVLQTGAGANQYAIAHSRRRVKYEAGVGVMCRFTAVFTAGVANSTQTIGIGGAAECFAFGYNGATFGILHRYGGQREIRTLTITTASSTAENITITLDGVTKSVAVTNSGNTTTTANEIAAASYATTGAGWTAKAAGNTVVFISRDSAVHSGAFTLSGATTAVGAFAQTVAAVVPTESWIAQSSWNGDDKFDGTGITGVTLDPTKGNVFQLDYQYLGFGIIRFFLEDPANGEMHLVHSIEYSNANTRPSLDNPSMSLFAAVKNTTNASNITLKTGSMAAFVEGIRKNLGVNRGIKRSATIGAAGDTPITSIRVSDVYQSKQNKSEIKLDYVSCAVEHSQPVQINFIANPTLTSASFTAIDTATSAVYQDTSATAYSGGVFLFALPLGKSGNQIIDLKDLIDFGRFGPGDVLTLTAEYSSGVNAAVRVSLNFTELF